MDDINNSSSWKLFLNTCIKIKDIDTLNKFFDLLLTMSEKNELTNRLLIVDELLKEILTQREISSQLKVSLAKVSRGSNALKTIDKDLKQSLIKIINHKIKP